MEFPTEPVLGVTVADLAWLVGHWRGQRGSDHVEETWGGLVCGSMLGMFRANRDGKPWFFELMHLEMDGEVVALRIKHFGPDFTGWEEKDQATNLVMVSHDESGALFYSHEPDKPTWLRYDRSGEIPLAVSLTAPGRDVAPDSVFRFTQRSAW